MADRAQVSVGAREIVGRAATLSRTMGIALAVFVLALVAVRLWLVSKIETPWIMSDELLYSELARSFADSGDFLVRGEWYPVYNLGYPLVVSPAWLADSMETTYTLAKTINVLLMATALIPLYLWARRLVSPLHAAVATGLTAFMPSFLYGGMIMTENAFFPAFVLSVFTFGLLLERPTLRRQALALAVVALAYFSRAQGLVVALILPAAVVLKLLLDARVTAAPGRWRQVSREALRYAPLAGVYAVAAIGYAAVQTARGVPLRTGLGAYAGVAEVSYSLSDSLHWTVEHVAELGLSVGLFPVFAFVILLGLAIWRGAESQAERAFLAVAAAAIPIVIVQVAFYASWFSLRIEERYMFFLAPLLFLAFALWLERNLPRPRLLTAFAVAGPAALLLALPLEKRLNISILSDTFTFIPLWRLVDKVDGVSTVRALMLGAGLVAALVFALLPRRLARPVLPAAVAAFFVLVTYSVFGSIRDQSRRTRNATAASQPDWVDAVLPHGSSAGFVFGGSADPFFEAQIGWQQEFWSRDLKKVYALAPEPASFAKTPVTIDGATGRIVSQDGSPFPYRYGLVSDTVALSGRLIAEHSPFALYDVRQPLSVTSLEEGVYDDGWTGADAAYSRFAGPAGVLDVRLSRTAWGGADVPGRVTLELGRPEIPAGGGVRLSATILRRTWIAHARGRHVFRLVTPKPPFRLELHVSPTFSPARLGQDDTRELGVQADFAFVPKSPSGA
jgi:hypothetical protein